MVTIKSPDELMEEFCYKPSSELSSNSGTAYKLDISPETIEFGSWATTKISNHQEFTITNSGYGDVKITKVDLYGDFLLVDPIPEIIEAGESYTGKLYFAPTTVGSLKGILSIDAEVSIGEKSINLFGTSYSILDPDIAGIANEPGLTIDTFPYWDDQLDIIVNTELPISVL
jgi:hypothetical protein